MAFAPERLHPELVCDLAEENLELAAGEPTPAIIVHFAAEIPTTFEDGDIEDIAERNQRIDNNVFAFAASVGA